MDAQHSLFHYLCFVVPSLRSLKDVSWICRANAFLLESRGLDETTCGKVDGHVGKGLSVLGSIKLRPGRHGFTAAWETRLSDGLLGRLVATKPKHPAP